MNTRSLTYALELPNFFLSKQHHTEAFSRQAEVVGEYGFYGYISPLHSTI